MNDFESPVIRMKTGGSDYALDHDNSVFHIFQEDYDYMNYLQHRYSIVTRMGKMAQQLIIFNEPELFEALNDNNYPQLWRYHPSDQDFALYQRYQEQNLERELDDFEARFRELEDGEA